MRADFACWQLKRRIRRREYGTIRKNRYWIWLSLIKGLGAIKKKKLLEIYKTPENIYKLDKDELLKIEGIGEKLGQIK